MRGLQIWIVAQFLPAALSAAGGAAADALREGEPPMTVELPFPPGSAYRVICGPGQAPHHASPRNFHAYDFDLPYGSEVSAAASGRVIRTEGRFDAPTGASEHNNFVMIEHEGGAVSEYHHLMQDGLLVGDGEWVERGEVIGFSGASGRAEGAHLHFVVVRGERSLPVAFRGLDEPPVKGTVCRSRNVPSGAAERHRTLESVDRALDVLLSERQLAPSRIIVEWALRDREPATTPSALRSVRALRPLEAALKRRVDRTDRSVFLASGGRSP